MSRSKRVQGKKIKINTFLQDHILERAGYKKLFNGSWVYDFEEFNDDKMDYYRYHIYEIEPGLLEIHTDLKKGKGKKSYHVASTFATAGEVRRIKSLLQVVEPVHGQRKSKNLCLSREARLKALEELGDPIIKRYVPEIRQKKVLWFSVIIDTLKRCVILF